MSAIVLTIALTAKQVAMNKMVTGDARRQFLGTTVKAYLDNEGYQEFVVHDFYPDSVLNATVVLHREIDGEKKSVYGIIFEDGIAIQMVTASSLEGYRDFLDLAFRVHKKEFNPGIEIRISKDLLKKLKTPVLAIQDKFRAYEGMFGRLKEAKPLKAFQPNDKGCIRTELEDGALTVKIDTRAVMFVVEMAADYTDYVLKKAVALMSLLDFSDFAYKAKEKMARFKKEVEDPLK